VLAVVKLAAMLNMLKGGMLLRRGVVGLREYACQCQLLTLASRVLSGCRASNAET
jgi:hypothetical protein